MKTDLTQMDRLTMLMMTEKSEVIVKRTDREPAFDGTGYIILNERHDLVVNTKDGEYLWDAICHPGSYGYEEGLLEVAGDPVASPDALDSVEGWLTADEIFARWQKWEAEHGEV